MTIEVLQTESAPMRPRRQEPVRLGVPLARGQCANPECISLSDSNGRLCPVQARVLDRWSDGSARWLLLDFHANHDGGSQPFRYTLKTGADAPSPPGSGSVLKASTSDGEVSIDSGPAQFRIRQGGRFPFEDVRIAGVPAIDPDRTRFEVEDDGGRVGRFVPSRVDLEEAGTVRAVVRAEGWIGGEGGEKRLQVLARLHFFTGSSTVRFDLTLRNPRRARHSGGFWELGDAGSVLIRDASFVVTTAPCPGVSEFRCSPESDMPLELFGQRIELYQDSSGGSNWSSRNHVNRHGVVPLTFRGYRLRGGKTETDGLRATPVVTLTRGSRHLALALRRFWENFPKAIEAADDTLILRLFPRQSADVHELQGGEQKTHAFVVAFDRDGVTDVPLDWVRAPLLARATPAHYCASDVVPYLVPWAQDPNADYLRLVAKAVDGDASFASKREVIDEYGWRSFGDLYADHEEVFYSGPKPIVSHYNNQYDAISGCALQFMRTGDLRWWDLFVDLAAHVADIDLYHTEHDKVAYNRALFWHTYHYIDAGLSSHRSYPRHKKVGGGGPTAEHNYSGGLVLHYFLTGDPLSRDAALDLARWVFDMDDGRTTRFRWLARGCSGYASETAVPGYHGPGRGAGNSINVLLDGHRLTGDLRFLRKAEQLVRRCIHPADDIPARDLLNAELRWSYTVFLYVLGKFLDYKAERNEIDDMHAYGRQALLAYARWMADHETPYLLRPERLEFPTETWAAQDMRKSDVFKFAAKHTLGDERARFLERASFFFHDSIERLTGMASHSLTRPTVLMLSHGYMHAYFDQHPDVTAPVPVVDRDFGRPEVFVSQKTRAKKRLVALMIAGGLTLVVAAVAALLAR